MSESLRKKAETLLALHQAGRILVLPNVWDAGSARIIEDAGFPAIATSSAGVAYTLARADGQQVSMDEMLTAVARIAGAVQVPVTADMEAGYGDVAATARGLLEAGAVGLNLEDMDGDQVSAQVPLPEQAERIRTVRATAQERGVHIVINARTDVYLAGIGPAETRFERAVERLRAFADAGADCLFVPGVVDEVTIGRLVNALPRPLNILATAGAPPVQRLQELGVRRVSLGSGPARAAFSVAQAIADELRKQGTYTRMEGASLTYAAAQKLFSKC